MIRELALDIEVLGEAKPAGSKRAFRTKTGRIVVTDANKGAKPWKQEVAHVAKEAFAYCAPCHATGEITVNTHVLRDPQFDRPERCPSCSGTGERLSDDLLTGPLAVEFVFYRARPKGHFRTGRLAHQLRPFAAPYPATRPDALKLARGVEDALQGVIYRDDAQIVEETLRKEYGTPERAEIRIWALQAVAQPQLKEAA